MTVLPIVLRGADPGTDAPDVLRLQPYPARVQVAHFRRTTAIARGWAEGDTGRCRLCERCTAHDDACLMIVTGRVERGDAALFSTVGLREEIDS